MFVNFQPYLYFRGLLPQVRPAVGAGPLLGTQSCLPFGNGNGKRKQKARGPSPSFFMCKKKAPTILYGVKLLIKK
jgi:hypothetical protein